MAAAHETADASVVPDSADAFPLDKDESIDADGDGVGDNADPDHGHPVDPPGPRPEQTRLAISHRKVPRAG